MRLRSLSSTLVLASLALLLFVSITRIYPHVRRQKVTFTVASAPAEASVSEVSLELRHRGKIISIPLSPAQGADGIRLWKAEWCPEVPTLMLPARVLVRRAGADTPEEAEVCLEPLHTGNNLLAWALEEDEGRHRAVRVSSAGTLEQVERTEVITVAVKACTAIVVLLLVLWMTGRYREAGRATALPSSPPSAKRTALLLGVLDLTIWLLLAAAWTWPAALAQHHEIVGRHYDSMGTTWVMHSAPRFSHQFKDAMSAWPTVADYRRMDSFVLVFLSILLSSFSAAKLHGLFQIIGVATSAWAAQGLARAMGARRPWDMIGGLCFAFSGLAAHALIEGHMYHIMCPWLPLFVWAWYRAMCENQKWHYGTIAGVLFCLSLLTSAYLGVSAALIAAGLFLATVIRKRTVPWLQTLAASAIALPVILAILHLYGGDGDGLSRDMTVSTALQASAHCLSVLGATPELDRVQHSLALELSPLLLALVIVAPVVLGKRSPYRVLMWIAVSGLLLSIGPGFSVSDDQALFRTPLSLLANTPLKVVLRFPIRFAWICNLCGGILAAAVVTQLSLSGRRTAWLLLLLALLLPFAATRLPARQRTLTWSTPDVYATCAAPILDLFPVQAWPPNFDEMWFHHLACAYQTDHGLTIAANGMHTTPEGQPQVRLGQWTTRQLLAGHSDEAAAMLSALGFKTIVFHSDLFLQQDRERLNAALLEFGSTQIESTNSSVRVIAQAIPQLSPALPEQERIERYEKLIDALDATPGGEPLVETLHTTLTWPHTSGNHIAALVGMAVYTLTAIGWFLKPRISKLLHERHSAAHS